MHFLSVLTAFLASAATVPALSTQVKLSSGGYLTVNPGNVEDMIVSKDTTLNGTYSGDARTIKPADLEGGVFTTAAVASSVRLHFVNKMGAAINAYVVGFDSNNAVVFVKNDGSLYYPSSGGSSVPVQIPDATVKIPVANGGTLDMSVPIALTSARIYYSVGSLYFGVVGTPIGEGLVQPAPQNPSDPSAGILWGFVEFTLTTDNVLWVNISYVDFLGLPLGIEVTSNSVAKQSAYGVGAGALTAVCNALKSQTSSDGRPWGSMCMTGSSGPVRALSPNSYTGIDSSGFATYWSTYVDQVWSKYTSQNLVIDTQTSAGKVNCRVSGSVMSCDGDNRGYSKPSAQDIWGCDSGPFGKQSGDNAVHLAVIPRLCAAFHRSTLQLSGGNVQPSLGPSSYYTVNPTNHFSRIIHANEVDGKGYAFPYDDVDPTGSTESASGLIQAPNPNTLSVWIGGPPV